MGRVNDELGAKVYLDTNIIIYALEGFAAFDDQIKALLQAMDDGEISAITSELTHAEVLPPEHICRPFLGLGMPIYRFPRLAGAHRWATRRRPFSRAKTFRRSACCQLAPVRLDEPKLNHLHQGGAQAGSMRYVRDYRGTPYKPRSSRLTWPSRNILDNVWRTDISFFPR